MGEKKCAFDGCNALEFRTSGYCLRHKNDTPSENTFSKTITKTSPITDTPAVPWGLMTSFAYIVVPIILFLNVITHEEPGGSIAPTGLLNIPCFVCSLFPLLLIGVYVNYLRDSTIT